MTPKFLRRFSIGTVCSFAIFSVALASADAQHVNVLPLQPPNYNDAAEVGRHIAFSMYFAELVQSDYATSSPKECRLKVLQHFPDLAVFQPESPIFPNRCHEHMALSLTTAEIDPSRFKAAVDRALSNMARIFDNSRYLRANPNPSPGFDEVQLAQLTQLALKHLYPDDPLLTPLLHFDEWAVSEAKNYDAFTDWVAGQRRTFQYRLKPYSKSILPSPPRPKFDYAKGISVSVPALHGRKFVLVRCDTVRDSNCSYKITGHICRQRYNEARAGTRNYHSSWPRCSAGIGQILNLPGWLAIDFDDVDAVKALYGDLSSPRPRASENYSSFIEFAVLVTVE